MVESAHLCFAATVSPDGKPNLSPKGTIRVLDDRRVFFLDIASPGTRRNLAANPWMEINVVDGLSRRGYRLFGRATVHRDDETHRACAARVAAEEGHDYRPHGVVVLDVERVLPIVSPGYETAPDEWAMREGWKPRRAALDAAFEGHVRARGPHRGNSSRGPPPRP